MENSKKKINAEGFEIRVPWKENSKLEKYYFSNLRQVKS